MDSVFWFIYFAGVAETVRITSGAMVIIGTILLIFITSAFYSEKKEVFPFLKQGILVISVCLFIFTFTPSSKLLYTMAGLKAGEVALQTEEGQKAMKLLNKKLDELLKEE